MWELLGEALTTGAFAYLLVSVLRHRGARGTALAGFSLGGLIVQSFAVAHPDRVSKLAILCAGHDRSDEERAGMLDRLRLAEREGHVVTVEMALERWFTPGFAIRQPDQRHRYQRLAAI